MQILNYSIVFFFFVVPEIVIDCSQGSYLFRSNHRAGLNPFRYVTVNFPKTSVSWNEKFVILSCQFLTSFSIYICTTVLYMIHSCPKKQNTFLFIYLF